VLVGVLVSALGEVWVLELAEVWVSALEEVLAWVQVEV
jgi:hypothetical protein